MTAYLAHQQAQRFLYQQQLEKDLAESQADIYVLNARELTEFWLTVQRHEGKSQSQIESVFNDLTGMDLSKQLLATGRDFGSASKDLTTVAVLGADLKRGSRFFESYRTVTQNGRNYIIFKGNHRARLIIKGTRYLATNTVMLKMAIGGEGLKASAKSGFIVSIVFSVTLHSIQWIFEDEYRWTHWLAGVTTDLVKIVIASAAGYLASIATAAGIAALTGGTIAVLPLAIGVVVCVGVGFTLNAIDDHFQITQSLVKHLEQKEAYIKRKAYDGVYYVIRSATESVQRKLIKSATRKINELVRFKFQLWN
ncbi:hypothetical protein [Rheinheimera maricola]|uniref:Uncharacterized protein n=1 Tax=Rheinheimera maricola TaxID=2793282 RepID=A0ABS7X4Q1_9GAMM|nr:hypothetical protein [Rheinheimera maricola]MBZ9610522.1 hypothetical protein [Rheinheimera maricola]